VRNEEITTELAQRFGFHPTMVATWKRALIEGVKCGDASKKCTETKKTDGSSREENRVGIGPAPLSGKLSDMG